MEPVQEPWGESWHTFFATHALPLAEAHAFAQYLTRLEVPGEASIQDLNAYYDEFRQHWEPETSG